MSARMTYVLVECVFIKITPYRAMTIYSARRRTLVPAADVWAAGTLVRMTRFIATAPNRVMKSMTHVRINIPARISLRTIRVPVLTH